MLQKKKLTLQDLLKTYQKWFKLSHFVSSEILRSVYFAIIQSPINYVCVA